MALTPRLLARVLEVQRADPDVPANVEDKLQLSNGHELTKWAIDRRLV